LCGRRAARKSSGVRVGRPSIAAMTSPGRRPARSAGPPGDTCATMTPSAELRPSSEAICGVMAAGTRPAKACRARPERRSCSAMSTAVAEGHGAGLGWDVSLADPHDLALRVREGAAGVPRADRGVRLDQIDERLTLGGATGDLPVKSGDDSRRHRVLKSERAPENNREAAHLREVSLERCRWQAPAVSLHEGEVDDRVRGLDHAAHLLTVGERHAHGAVSPHHVLVGEDESLRRIDNPAAHTAADEHRDNTRFELRHHARDLFQATGHR
jgi:hypothetical protein